MEKSQILRLFVSILSVLKIMGDTVLGMRKTGCFGNWVLKWRKELKFYRHGARKISLFSLYTNENRPEVLAIESQAGCLIIFLKCEK